ncbi:MAG: hypothetical protein ACLUNV_06980 [Sutterella wadsworthensis]
MPAPEAFSWITRDEERTFEFLLVDRFLKPCADRPLTLAVMARQSVTELASDSTGRLRYDERSVERPVRESAVTTDANGRTTASLNTSAPGDFSSSSRTNRAACSRACPITSQAKTAAPRPFGRPARRHGKARFRQVDL